MTREVKRAGSRKTRGETRADRMLKNQKIWAGRWLTSKPIYVEIDIETDINKLWVHTQTPELHEQWDLRFSEITYLPLVEGVEPTQRFEYRTRIGFGLDIKGTGETKGGVENSTGERTSSLTFGSEQSISLIRTGGGYWKYKAGTGEGVTFITQYDYRTRFGIVGKVFDRVLFRPLFGYATAWSFDLLRIWLEKQIAPAVSIQQAFLHYLSVITLMVLWLYQGTIPKLIYPETGDLALLREAGWFIGWENVVVYTTGVFEVGFALLLAIGHRWKVIYRLHAILLVFLGIMALAGIPSILRAAFNPFTLNLAMLALGAVAALTTQNLPNAARCLRKPSPTNKGGK